MAAASFYISNSVLQEEAEGLPAAEATCIDFLHLCTFLLALQVSNLVFKIGLIGAHFSPPFASGIVEGFLLAITQAFCLTHKVIHVEDGAEVEEGKHPEDAVRLKSTLHECLCDQIQYKDC